VSLYLGKKGAYLLSVRRSTTNVSKGGILNGGVESLGGGDERVSSPQKQELYETSFPISREISRRNFNGGEGGRRDTFFAS